mmetsp:Transcript_3975/g.11018  ORF Transcript_3975/g.11018 Transcript_3975/m.11018 type:complete len:233 (+) Transcript_3975:216-914(+)
MTWGCMPPQTSSWLALRLLRCLPCRWPSAQHWCLRPCPHLPSRHPQHLTASSVPVRLHLWRRQWSRQRRWQPSGQPGSPAAAAAAAEAPCLRAHAARPPGPPRPPASAVATAAVLMTMVAAVAQRRLQSYCGLIPPHCSRRTPARSLLICRRFRSCGSPMRWRSHCRQWVPRGTTWALASPAPLCTPRVATTGRTASSAISVRPVPPSGGRRHCEHTCGGARKVLPCGMARV